MQILITTVPNAAIKNRKGFGGADWWWEKIVKSGQLETIEILYIRVASELTKDEQICLIVHELVEALLCWAFGISTEDVDAFDAKYMEEEKNPSFNSGDQDGAPYRLPHMFATAAERIVAGVLHVSWTEYDKSLSKL